MWACAKNAHFSALVSSSSTAQTPFQCTCSPPLSPALQPPCPASTRWSPLSEGAPRSRHACRAQRKCAGWWSSFFNADSIAACSASSDSLGAFALFDWISWRAQPPAPLPQRTSAPPCSPRQVHRRRLRDCQALPNRLEHCDCFSVVARANTSTSRGCSWIIARWAMTSPSPLTPLIHPRSSATRRWWIG